VLVTDIDASDDAVRGYLEAGLEVVRA